MPQSRPVKGKMPVAAETNRAPQTSEESYQFVEEDAIDLLDMLIVLLRHKKLIIGMVLVAGLAALVITVIRSETGVYKSEAIIVPQLGDPLLQPQYRLGSSQTEELLKILNSRGLTVKVIEKYNLMPVLFFEHWDKKGKKWRGDPPTLHSACETMKGLFRAIPAKGKDFNRLSWSMQKPISVSIRYKEPEMAKEFVEYYLNELSETLRNEVRQDAAEKKRSLEKRLKTVVDPLMKDKLRILRANEVERETLAKTQQYYGFTVTDSPVVPARFSVENSGVIRNMLLAMTVALFLGVFLAFIIEYFHRIKTENPERYQELIRELKTWKSSNKKR